MSSAERKKNLLDSLERSRNNTSLESETVRRRKPTEKRAQEFDLLNVQSLRRRHNSNQTSDEINSSLEYNEVNNRPDILDSLNRRRRTESDDKERVLIELRRRSTESADSDSSSPKKHSRRNHWSADSDSDCEEIRSLIRRSSSQLEAAENLMAQHDSSPDLVRAFDYVRTFDDYSSCDDIPQNLSRKPACFRARLCLALAAFSLIIIIYIHLQ